MLVLSGDFDASGMDISRSFVEMTSCWKKVHRIGLDEGLITRDGLPVLRGKATDSQAADFIAAHPETTPDTASGRTRRTGRTRCRWSWTPWTPVSCAACTSG